jgi:hypothetical protein
VPSEISPLGMQLQAAANYRATVARNNAEYSRQVGDVQAQAQQRKTQQVLGRQTAAMGASGVEVGGGSFGNVLKTTQDLGRLDEMTILNRAANKALGLENEASLETFSGQQAKNEGYLKAATSILSSVSSVSSKWDSYKAKGIKSIWSG